MKKIETIASLLFLLGGISILLFGFIEARSDNEEGFVERQPGELLDQEVDLSVLSKYQLLNGDSQSLNSTDAIALFVIDTKTCASGLNNVSEFASILDTLLHRDGYSVHSMALIVSDGCTTNCTTPPFASLL